MIKSSVLSPFNFNLLTKSRMKYPINRLEYERPPTNGKKNNRKKTKSGDHQHRNETPFHVDVLRHPTGKYIANKEKVPKTGPFGTPKTKSVEKELEPLMHTCSIFKIRWKPL